MLSETVCAFLCSREKEGLQAREVQRRERWSTRTTWREKEVLEINDGSEDKQQTTCSFTFTISRGKQAPKLQKAVLKTLLLHI